MILASSSPRRRELLAQLGLPFTVLAPDIDESPSPGEAHIEHVQRLSREKAQAAARAMPGIEQADAVLAADTIVIDAQGQLLGKPADADHARQILRQLRNRVHTVTTAFTLYLPGSPPRQITEAVCTTVAMRDYSDVEIERYIASGDPLDKAGAYAIQNENFSPVAHIDGSYSNVVGLPLEALAAALHRCGLLPADEP